MLRKMYAWAVAKAHTPQAVYILAAVSFLESSFFPIPPDAMLLPMCLADRRRAWLFAAVCTVASVLGGILGYAIGALLYDTLGAWLINLYGLAEQAEHFKQAYAEYGAAIILLKGLTPIPYKLVTIVSGLAGYPLMAFIILSAITRGARFFLIAALLRRYGEPMRLFVEKHLEKVTLAMLVIIVLGFVSLKYIV